MSDVYSEWVGHEDRTDAPEYLLAARAHAYLIKINGKYVKVRVFDEQPPEHAPAGSKEATPAPAPLPPRAQIRRGLRETP
jgi:hypothetical protein